MLRLSKLADYAAVLLVQLDRHDELATSGMLSAETGVPEPTVAKILKGLAGNGFVLSQRGARGGYRLARSLDTISIAQVIGAMDGPIAVTTCVEGRACEASGTCALSGNWDMVNDAIVRTLDSITLAEMSRGRRNGFASARVALGASVAP